MKRLLTANNINNNIPMDTKHSHSKDLPTEKTLQHLTKALKDYMTIIQGFTKSIKEYTKSTKEYTKAIVKLKTKI